jgi:hypothetical protein
MKKYYKRGDSIYCLDIQSDDIVCVTNSELNKGIIYTTGYNNSATIMNDSFSSSLSTSNVPGGGYPTLNSNEDEFLTSKNQILQILLSQSINL